MATSWRNEYYQDILKALRDAGHEVYDFRDEGFSWDDVDTNWRNWTPNQYVTKLEFPRTEDGFQRDLNAIYWCNTLIMLMPCGLSAGIELGLAAGLGKPTAVLVTPTYGEADLMIKVAGKVFDSKETLLEWLAEENRWFEWVVKENK